MDASRTPTDGGRDAATLDAAQPDAASNHQDGAAPAEAGIARDAASNAPLSCPTQDGGSVALPNGACTGVGACAIEQTLTCGPGVLVVPATPAIFSCECREGTWSCNKVGGGLGVLPCDAGSS
jgi:hypothetical protein